MPLARPKAWLRVKPALWSELVAELGRRTDGKREAGAFLLGHRERHRVEAVAYYDDLDPHSLNGAVAFDFEGYAELAQLCERTGLVVIGDVHTHGGTYIEQSGIDRDNPMVARAGHVALIVPHLATRPSEPKEVGVHRYLGDEGWDSRISKAARRALYVGRWA